MKYQDGTQPGAAPRPLSAEDRTWLEEAMKGAMIDLSNRMVDITSALNEGEGGSAAANAAAASTAPPATLEEKERLLEELVEIVESIDQAKDLATVGGLPTLLALLRGPELSLAWRAAEVMATCVQNNPEVQETFLEKQVPQAVLPLVSAAQAIVRVKAWLALSCQVRGHAPSLRWFLGEGGVAHLVEATCDEDPRVHRKALQLLAYVLAAAPAGAAAGAVPADGAALVPRLTALVAESEDEDVRVASLGVLRVLAADSGSRAALAASGIVAATVQSALCRLDALPREDWGPAEEEAELAKTVLDLLNRKDEGAPAPAAAAQGDGSGMQIMTLPE